MRKRFLITVALALSAAAPSVVAHGRPVSAVLPTGRLPGAPNCPMFPDLAGKLPAIEVLDHL